MRRLRHAPTVEGLRLIRHRPGCRSTPTPRRSCSQDSSSSLCSAGGGVQLGLQGSQPGVVRRDRRHLAVQPLDPGPDLGQLGLDPGQVLAGLPGLRPRPWASGRRAAGRARVGLGRAPAVQVLLDPAGQQHAGAVAHQGVGDVAGALQEVAVVGDHQQRARPGVQVVLEHGQGVDVQVVGRLVQQQHVRLGEQQPQELQPPPLAAGEVVQPGGQPLAGEAEVLQQRAGAGLPPGGQPGLPADLLHRLQHPLAIRGARPPSG